MVLCIEPQKIYSTGGGGFHEIAFLGTFSHESSRPIQHATMLSFYYTAIDYILNGNIAFTDEESSRK